MALGVTVFGLDGHGAHDTQLPAHAGTHKQRDAINLQFHHLGQIAAERLSGEVAGLLKDLVEIGELQGTFAELGKDILLSKQFSFAAGGHSDRPFTLRRII
jgi:hypothetical protein